VSTTRSATELVVEFRTQSRLLATNVILLDSVRYLGAIDGLNRFGYRVESVVSGQSNLSFDVMLETDSLSRRRTFQSVRVSDGQALIRDGKLSDGSAMPFLVKCEQAR
jgi:hypothetical protein